MMGLKVGDRGGSALKGPRGREGLGAEGTWREERGFAYRGRGEGRPMQKGQRGGGNEGPG